jgi:glycosyltransferase involved in cell wall biosynthesis
MDQQNTTHSSKIKIFYFIPNLAQGGPERQLLLLIKNLPDHFEPILCLYHDEVFYSKDLPSDQPRYVLGNPKIGWKEYRKLVKILKKEQPHILHSYRDKSNFWARLAAFEAKVPIILSSCRNRMMEPKYLVLERWISSHTQGILTNSIGVKEELVHWGRVRPELIKIIPNILDTSLFRPPNETERLEARKRWSITKEQRAFILPGRIGIQKHQLGLLLSLVLLKAKKRLDENTVFLFAGRRRDLKTAWLVDRLAKWPGLKPHLRFLGAQKDIRSLYWASDVLIMPSLWEGLSNAAMEACACGLPAILSVSANIDGIIAHGLEGIQVGDFSVTNLAEAIEKMQRYSQEELQEMGMKARARVTRVFAPQPDMVFKRIVEVYNDKLHKSH